MELTKEEEILALSSAIYLLGMETEAGLAEMETMLDNGVPMHAPAFLKAYEVVQRNRLEFSKLEKRFLTLQKELGLDQ